MIRPQKIDDELRQGRLDAKTLDSMFRRRIKEGAMTTRRWMIAVAVMAMLMGGVIEAQRLMRRRDEFLSRAQWHSVIVTTWNANWRPAPTGATQRRMAYHGSLASKYWYAARYPWLPVEPDPSPPDPWLPIELDPPPPEP